MSVSIDVRFHSTSQNHTHFQRLGWIIASWFARGLRIGGAIELASIWKHQIQTIKLQPRSLSCRKSKNKKKTEKFQKFAPPVFRFLQNLRNRLVKKNIITKDENQKPFSEFFSNDFSELEKWENFWKSFRISAGSDFHR